MKRLNSTLLKVIISIAFILILSPLAFAEVEEPIVRLNISPVEGAAGSGLVRAVLSHDKYDYAPNSKFDATIITLRGEVSIKLLDQVGVGMSVPYYRIENQDMYIGNPGADDNVSGGGNVVIGANVTLPPPSERLSLVVGANTTLPTADEDVDRKLSTIEPYALILTSDGELSFTMSMGYNFIVDENKKDGQKDIYDNVFTLQGSVMYTANEIFSLGAQYLVVAADNTMIEFIPQVRAKIEQLIWGVALSIPISKNHPQFSNLDKSFGIMFELGHKF